jgi:hypothetical protein
VPAVVPEVVLTASEKVVISILPASYS